MVCGYSGQAEVSHGAMESTGQGGSSRFWGGLEGCFVLGRYYVCTHTVGLNKMDSTLVASTFLIFYSLCNILVELTPNIIVYMHRLEPTGYR